MQKTTKTTLLPLPAPLARPPLAAPGEGARRHRAARGGGGGKQGKAGSHEGLCAGEQTRAPRQGSIQSSDTAAIESSYWSAASPIVFKIIKILIHKA